MKQQTASLSKSFSLPEGSSASVVPHWRELPEDSPLFQRFTITRLSRDLIFVQVEQRPIISHHSSGSSKVLTFIFLAPSPEIAQHTCRIITLNQNSTRVYSKSKMFIVPKYKLNAVHGNSEISLVVFLFLSYSILRWMSRDFDNSHTLPCWQVNKKIWLVKF